MYCPSCGAFNPDNSKFCSGCGARLQIVQVPVAPAKKSKSPSIIARLFVAIVIFALLGLFADKVWKEVETMLGKAANTTEKAPVATPTPTQQPVYKLGDTVMVHNLEFTVTSYTFSKYAGALGTLNPADNDTVYCVVYVTVHNPTDTAQRISSETITGSYSLDYSSDLVFDGAYTYYSSFAEYAGGSLDCRRHQPSVRPPAT